MSNPTLDYLQGQQDAAQGGGIPYGSTNPYYFAGAAQQHERMQNDAKHKEFMSSTSSSRNYYGAVHTRAGSTDGVEGGAVIIALLIILATILAFFILLKEGASDRSTEQTRRDAEDRKYNQSKESRGYSGVVAVQSLKLRQCPPKDNHVCPAKAIILRNQEFLVVGGADHEWLNVVIRAKNGILVGYIYKPMVILRPLS